MGVYLGRHQKGGKDGCGAHMARRVKKRGNENEFANNFHTPTVKAQCPSRHLQRMCLAKAESLLLRRMRNSSCLRLRLRRAMVGRLLW